MHPQILMALLPALVLANPLPEHTELKSTSVTATITKSVDETPTSAPGLLAKLVERAEEIFTGTPTKGNLTIDSAKLTSSTPAPTLLARGNMDYGASPDGKSVSVSSTQDSSSAFTYFMPNPTAPGHFAVMVAVGTATPSSIGTTELPVGPTVAPSKTAMKHEARYVISTSTSSESIVPIKTDSAELEASNDQAFKDGGKIGV